MSEICRDSIKHSNVHAVIVLEEEKKKNEAKEVSECILTKNFSSWKSFHYLPTIIVVIYSEVVSGY